MEIDKIIEELKNNEEINDAIDRFGEWKQMEMWRIIEPIAKEILVRNLKELKELKEENEILKDEVKARNEEINHLQDRK